MSCHRAEALDLAVLFREPDSPECRDFAAHAGGCADCAAALQRFREPPNEPARRTPMVAVAGAAAVVLVVIVLLALQDHRRDAPQSAPEASGRPAPEEAVGIPAAARPASAAATLDTLQLDVGESREIVAAELPSERPLLLSLRVPSVTDGVSELPLRLLAEDGRVLEGAAAVAADRRERVDFPVEAGWLSRPGRYIVEVKTTEKTHFPLVRYAIVVR